MPKETTLTSAAKTIGKAAGKIASVAGVHADRPARTGKLPKKNKARLPRKQKKAMRKSQAVPMM
jgi:hypothetical protein